MKVALRILVVTGFITLLFAWFNGTFNAHLWAENIQGAWIMSFGSWLSFEVGVLLYTTIQKPHTK